MRNFVWSALLCLGVFLSCAPAVVQAQTSNLPTNRLNLPWGTVADPDGALSQRLNPAATSFQDGWSLSLLLTDTDNFLKSDNGDGIGLFWSSRALGRFGFGVSTQFFLPKDNGFRDFYAALSLSSSLKVSSSLSVSYTVHIFAGGGDKVNGAPTFDLSFLYRPSNWLSIGGNIRNLFTPDVGPGPLSRYWEAGVAIRPLLDNRLTLSADVLLEESSNIVSMRYQLESTVVNGLVLGINATHALNTSQTSPDFSLRFFLTLHFGSQSATMAGGVDLNNSGSSPARFSGGSIALGLRNIGHKPLLPPSQVIPVLSLGGTLPERNRSFGSSAAGGPVFLSYLLALRRFERDPNVRVLLLRLGGIRAGLAKVQELRNALQRIRKAGKTILVYMEGASLKSYYLASVANHIFFHPAGTLFMSGLSSQRIFLAGTLQDLGIKAEFIKRGKFKTAPNRFTHKDFSPSDRKATHSLLGDLFQQVVEGMASSRKIKKAKVMSWFKHGLFTAQDAKKFGLVQQLIHWDQIGGKIARLLRVRLRLDGRYFYRRTQRKRWRGYPRVAVIHVDGVISSGRNFDDVLFGQHLSGSFTLVRMLERVRYDSSVKAVVLRVDSPGGSVIASDRIWRAVKLLKRVKPVVVSMAGVAASGGYYIAAPATRIFASPGTITGSIGVYAGKFDFSGFFRKLGANPAIIKKGPAADLYSAVRPFSSVHRKMMERNIGQTYLSFLKKVAKGRKLKLAAVKKVAAGRVWTGRQAKKVGLVDEIGGFLDAIALARKLGGLPVGAKVDYLSLPSSLNWQFSLSSLPFLKSGKKIEKVLNDLVRWKKILRQIQQPQMWVLVNQPLPR